jgi:ribosome-binding protein aMBF1 (putative translation factor)
MRSKVVQRLMDEMEKEGNMITNWLDQHGNPEIEAFIEKNLAITDKVLTALEAKGWSKGQLAEAMGESPSEVSKWLSGMHNLTLKSIIKMEAALGIDLIYCEPVKTTKK